MPRPSLRTRSRKRRSLRMPGGSTKTHYKREKTSVSRCSRCGQALSGVPHSTPSELRKLTASQRRLERVYGGQLCHNCVRELLKQAVRSA
ncbi:MAG: 50S ribosomal protein L34e [Candidatus Bathyarchaeota archaeon]|nr:50S ribosomal protein L34e [Candidatus Bathyarchaeota archaeon]MDH5532435.1 50S ribosomal protein L34e [Candidatus Bathyarchaeota archaeon]